MFVEKVSLERIEGLKNYILIRVSDLAAKRKSGITTPTFQNFA